MNILQRVTAPTPPFFQKVRNIGLIIAAVSAAVIHAPLALPPLLAKMLGVLVVAGSAASAVSQTTVHDEPSPDDAADTQE
jgi:hypothetical protein